MGIPINVMHYIRSETIRQNGLEEQMTDAYLVAKHHEGELTEIFVLDLGTCFGYTWYRTTPVTFASGGHAANAQVLSKSIPRLIKHCPEEKGDFSEWYAWIKAFLQLHPFEDGNGRTASLLFNWGMNTLDEPFALPYYNFN